MVKGSRDRELWELERRYSVAGEPGLTRLATSELSSRPPPPSMGMVPSASEDLHAWSIYRQNLNSDFTDSALGSSEKSPLPYGNFQLRESTVQSILSHPRYGPKSPLGSNMYTYLKFGLPRVFPPNGGGPRGPRDGSSGYDSSDDGGTSPRHDKRGHAYYLRTRSDPDFRNAPYSGPSLRQPLPGMGPGVGANRGKSISEANLLSPDAMLRHPPHSSYEHRRSMHDLRAGMAYSDLGQSAHVLMHHHGQGGRPASVAVVGQGLHHGGSQTMLDGATSVLSIPLSHREPNTMSFQVNRPEVYSGQYPHLQVRGLDVEGANKEPLLQGVTLEVRAGEILAIMATTVTEGKALLDALAGRRKARIAHVILNGQTLSQISLRRRVAYVRSDFVLAPNLSVAQTLAFYARLRRPPKTSAAAAGKISTKEQMGLLIEELGLAQVLNTKVSSLTASETQRLNLACHLVSDAEILLLNRPTRHMDIFDTFFLVEFLRQWASGGTGGVSGRIVILSLQPPTYEIFTMVSRVTLISGGRMMYSGRRRDMLPYFAAADYPCPAFKNPSDYYLDLVTLDDLSAEAMLESSQRIEQLAELFRRRQEPLSDPGPPQGLPGKVRSANIFQQIIALFMRQTIYSQPSSLCTWLSHLLLAVALSLIIGAVFWDIPSSDPQLLLGDRLGFHYTLMCVACFAMLPSVAVSKCHGMDRLAAESDVTDSLYSRFLYIIVTTLVGIPASLVIWLGYIIPAYEMAGLYNQGTHFNSFYVYLGYMLVELSALQYLVTFISYICPGRLSGGIFSALVLTVLALVSGFTVHLWDLTKKWDRDWFGVISPARWVLPAIASREYSAEALEASSAQLICRNKQVQHQDIIVHLPCPVPNGTHALNYQGLSLPSSLPFQFTDWQPFWPPLVVTFISIFLIIFTFMITGRCYKHKSRNGRK